MPESVDVWLYQREPDTIAEVQSQIDLARKLEVKQVLLWEADYIDSKANKAQLQAAMRSAAGR